MTLLNIKSRLLRIAAVTALIPITIKVYLIACLRVGQVTFLSSTFDSFMNFINLFRIDIIVKFKIQNAKTKMRILNIEYSIFVCL